MREAVIIAAVRTPIGKFQGSLSALSAVELGACVVRDVVRRAQIEPSSVDEVIMGNVVSAGLAPGNYQVVETVPLGTAHAPEKLVAGFTLLSKQP